MKYFISYTHGDLNLTGRSVIEINGEIEGEDDITSIEEYIVKEKDFSNVCVVNYIEIHSKG